MEKRNYKVIAPVKRIGGAPVPSNREVRLSDAEALYEKALGRVEVTAKSNRNARRPRRS